MTISTVVHSGRQPARKGIFRLTLCFCCWLGLIAGSAAYTPRAAAQFLPGHPPVRAQAPAGSLTTRQEEQRQKRIDNPEPHDAANIYRHSKNVVTVARWFGLPVETTSLIFEAINFVILVILIVWLIGKVLPKALRGRTERIRAEIEQARIATEEAGRRLAKVEERLGRLDGEIEAIRLKANQETTLEEKRLREAMEQEKQAILDAAAQDIGAATKNAQSQLKRMAADLVIEHARRRISLSPESDRTLVEGFLTDLKRTHPDGGVN